MEEIDFMASRKIRKIVHCSRKLDFGGTNEIYPLLSSIVSNH